MSMYAGEGESVDDAKADLGTLKELQGELVVGTLDAAVIPKNEHGKVKIVDNLCFPQPSSACGKGAKRETSLLDFHTLGVSNIPVAHDG
jgi:hypothetical protein